jgi:hypothetical protein
MDGSMMDARSHNSIIQAQEKKGLKIEPNGLVMLYKLLNFFLLNGMN